MIFNPRWFILSGGSMGYRVIKVSDRVYRWLLELRSRFGVESPNQVLERFVDGFGDGSVAATENDVEVTSLRDFVSDAVLSMYSMYRGERARGPKAFRYPGGDYFIKDFLVGLLRGSGCKYLVEVFGGSGVVSMYAPRDVFKIIVYNDIDDVLVSFFRVVVERPDDFQRVSALLPYSRGLFRYFKDLLSRGSLDPFSKAALLYYIHMVSVNGLGETFGVSLKHSHTVYFKSSVANKIAEVAKRFSDVHIENLDWRDVIDKYDREGVVFYLDPPYVSVNVDAVRDRESYYRYGFGAGDARLLATRLSRIKGKYLLKIHEDQLQLYGPYLGRYYVKRLDYSVKMTVSYGEGSRPSFRYVFLTNYPVGIDRFASNQ
jgi:DNA adenine methylase